MNDLLLNIKLTLPLQSEAQSSSAHGLTSIRWELTFLPFLFQLTLGLGSPVAWQTNETTPPETPIWSTGTLVNRGGAEERGRQGADREREKGQRKKTDISTNHKMNAVLLKLTLLLLNKYIYISERKGFQMPA